ncbi:MAG: NADH-quinone oxidoreductase subunit NuoN [Neisseriaceae bacterium]|nr:NADH-quinone oxidoreductase subunit NuoN [Neisseriaceae bacterium]
MDFAQMNLTAALPEIFLLCLLGVVLIVDLFLKDSQRYVTHALTQLGLIITCGLQMYAYSHGSHHEEAFGGMFINDGIAQFAKIVLYAVIFLLLAYSRRYLQDRQLFKGEYYTLTLFAVLGMCVMISAQHFILLYIGLELLSLSLYALIAMRSNDTFASEAALKYFVLGSLASGMLLYGMSMVYGGTGGQLGLKEVLTALYMNEANPVLIKLGLVFMVVGIAFKFGAVPFHMWVPDVYQGSPTAVTALVASAPKIAATVFAFRILIEGMGVNLADWSGMLTILAVASLLVGNLAAIMQSNIKRMLAYSTVSHMGFVLLAFVGNEFTGTGSGSLNGVSAAFFYALTYAIMSLVAFGILLALSAKGKECENISDLAGLNRKHPWYAFLMLLAMFSMAGIPPLMGFAAKFYVVVALLEQKLVPLAVFAMIMSLIGAFYYLRVVKTMYFDELPEDGGANENLGFAAYALLSINALILLVLGIVPAQVMEICNTILR